ncbi:MAG: GGDEF domain-containing protein, partial [Gallionella sp.]|nr:GGDEF domain-containing protein [Gallionella sp.]
MSTPKDSKDSALNWAGLIRDVLHQLETPHKGITLTRKKDGLEVVLNRFGTKPDVLFEKLAALQQSWGNASSDRGPLVTTLPNSVSPASTKPAGESTPAPATDSTAILQQLRELLAQSLENTLTTHPELAEEIRQLAAQVRATNDPARINELAKPLRQFWLKLELRGGDKVKIQEGLMRLLRLLVENVSELVSDDEWVHGQISALQEIIAQPLDKRSIADAERSLRDAIIKQST